MPKNNQKYVERCFVALEVGNLLSPEWNGDALFGVKFFPCEVFHFFQIFLKKTSSFSKHPMIGDWGNFGNFGMPQTTLLENHNFWHVEVWDLFFLSFDYTLGVFPPSRIPVTRKNYEPFLGSGFPINLHLPRKTGPHPNYIPIDIYKSQKDLQMACRCSGMFCKLFSPGTWNICL